MLILSVWMAGDVLLERTFPGTSIWNAKYAALEKEAGMAQAGFPQLWGELPIFPGSSPHAFFYNSNAKTARVRSEQGSGEMVPEAAQSCF